jgi:hypothetical protein
LEILGGVPIVKDIRQWEINDHQDVVCVEIMAKLLELMSIP